LPQGDVSGVSTHAELAGVFQESVFAIGEITADLLLTLVEKAAEGRQQNVPRPEQEG
jgi:hypothetical protein